MWVDYPVGLKVVRYGRAINDETTAVFRAAFEENLARLRSMRAALRAAPPAETQESQP
jgi:hypothetical protein